MKVTGGATLHAPIAAVWAALTDPATLAQAIPGCERLAATGPDTYDLTVTAGVGTITGTYTGQIRLADQQRPASLLLQANGSGAPGTVSTDVRVLLADDGSGATQLSYDADAAIGGMIAGVGQRMLAAVAKRQAAQFFTTLDDLLTGGPAAAAAGPATEPAGTTWERPPAAASPGLPRPGSFGQGVLVGAGVALAGVVAGGLIARRKR